MDWISVSSDCLSAIAYEDGTLLCQIRTSGRVYSYEGVPLGVWIDFLGAPSKGKFYNSHIKPHHRATELTTAQTRHHQIGIEIQRGGRRRGRTR